MRRLFVAHICRRRFFGVAVLLLAIILGFWGFEAMEDYELSKADNQPAAPPAGDVRVIIKLT